MSRPLVLLLILAVMEFATTQANAADKYALLIGVNKYEHSGMWELKYPEDDAKALGDLLKSGGYKVELLLGKVATQTAIREQLESLRLKGTSEGVVVLGLFGHGVEVETVDGKVVARDACFCPFDASIRNTKNSKGKDLDRADKQKLIEPDPETLVKLSEVISMFQLAKSGHRVLLTDCGRTVLNQTPSRSLSTGSTMTDLPENTAILFGCSAGEGGTEHSKWGHGAYSLALLEELPALANEGPVKMGTLSDRVQRRVSKLLDDTFDGHISQTPLLWCTESVDLQWEIQNPKR